MFWRRCYLGFFDFDSCLKATNGIKWLGSKWSSNNHGKLILCETARSQYPTPFAPWSLSYFPFPCMTETVRGQSNSVAHWHWQEGFVFFQRLKKASRLMKQLKQNQWTWREVCGKHWVAKHLGLTAVFSVFPISWASFSVGETRDDQWPGWQHRGTLRF